MASRTRALTVVDRTTIALRLGDGWGIRRIATALSRPVVFAAELESAVTGLFIPDEHAPGREAPEERREHGPLYTIQSTPLYAIGFTGVTLGLARRMLETYTALARGRHSKASLNSMANNNAVQREIGLLEAKLSTARAFLHEAVNQTYDAATNAT